MSLLVLTNDDGIDAPGIQALRTAVAEIGKSVVVAPDSHLSGCSHQINRGGAIAIDQRSKTDYAIGGTPADCSRVALSHLYPDADWCFLALMLEAIWGRIRMCLGRLQLCGRLRCCESGQLPFRNIAIDLSLLIGSGRLG